jgi:hypothetical protein
MFSVRDFVRRLAAALLGAVTCLVVLSAVPHLGASAPIGQRTSTTSTRYLDLVKRYRDGE